MSRVLDLIDRGAALLEREPPSTITFKGKTYPCTVDYVAKRESIGSNTRQTEADFDATIFIRKCHYPGLPPEIGTMATARTIVQVGGVSYTRTLKGIIQEVRDDEAGLSFFLDSSQK